MAGGYRDKHFWWGSVLLGGGVFFAIEGAFNTWFRTGKLFPGPHLFAGAGIVALWALAAALVPQMQKGNEGARNAHIALNALNLALFAWQVKIAPPRRAEGSLAWDSGWQWLGTLAAGQTDVKAVAGRCSPQHVMQQPADFVGGCEWSCCHCCRCLPVWRLLARFSSSPSGRECAWPCAVRLSRRLLC